MAALAVAAIVVLALAASVSGQAGCAGIGSTAQANLLASFRNNVVCMKGLPNYVAAGSAVGVNAMIQRTHDYALSDAPVLPCRTTIINVGYAVGLMAVHSKASAALQAFKFDGCALGKIYTLGSTAAWNNPLITRLNANLKTVTTKIAVLRRAEPGAGSGTTYTFTNMMGKLCRAQWTYGSLYKFETQPAGLKVLLANSVAVIGTGGMRDAFNARPSAIGYIAAGAIAATSQSGLIPKNNAQVPIKPGGTRYDLLAQGLNPGTPTCGSATDITAVAPGNAAVYPFVYIAWFLGSPANRAGQKPCVKAICNCLMAPASQSALGSRIPGSTDFRGVPAAIVGTMRGRCALM